MNINIHFTNQNIRDNLRELFLFYKLRMFAANNGGWFNGYEFKNSDKYKILPKLRELGWIDKNQDKVNNYREICEDWNCVSLSTKIEEKHLINKDTFKGFVIACAEVYCLRRRLLRHNKRSRKISHRSNTLVKNDWDKAKYPQKRHLIGKISSDTEDNYDNMLFGRAYNKELSDLLEVGIATISRWRKFSKENKFNTYYYDLFRSDKAGKTKSRRIAQQGRVAKGGFSTKHGGFVLKDLLIKSTSIVIYINKRYEGFTRKTKSGER